KAVLALFAAGDALAGQAVAQVRRLKDAAPLSFLIIDLGGGLAPGRSAAVALADVLSDPLAALCRGMATPGLPWGKTAGAPITAGTGPDRRELPPEAEPADRSNYALATRDYVNLNARTESHFAMIDAVCGANPRENAIRFRFKGGSAAAELRERRAIFIETVLREQEFFTNRQGDMVTAVLAEGARETVRAKLEMLGRLLGFSRNLDAAMAGDDPAGRLVSAFLGGDYSLESLAGRSGAKAQA
ncbi:MAG: pyruvate, phosphate dikinase, partial [Desulfovibrionaceae bacterium]|nr:pyruvate, phosphate dikinase [Desulfovibrionaceae bacterium]